MLKRSLDEQLASVYERDLVKMQLPVRKGLVRFSIDKPQLKRSRVNVPDDNVAKVRRRPEYSISGALDIFILLHSPKIGFYIPYSQLLTLHP